ncbi:heme lyase CcmF/NrfE family subunit [Sphingomicrobium lutaoense]|uniref:Cytochrome c-type biogenesis protein CcmF n=1 Tax=Sphingomicrobium lutaoense TaxID=515949 RepID=A0A839YZ33_9SPHN|nr:heme lyase CcmF/NrfE family subunit [Sphingomicrobium lutaoense]MBB3763578.1 cytochrome c-type biogenesis protein CcmF [Sphingomicrobium lutaoense]
MIAEFAHGALWLAAALCLMQLGLGVAALRGEQAISRAIRPIAAIQALLVVTAFAALIWLFWRTDLSVALVAANSHSAKPLLYKIAGAWGNHEGSMLLWLTVLTGSGALFAAFEKRLEARTMAASLAAQAAIGIGFFAFLLLSSNPFERLNPSAVEGKGLNPLLQDPGLAFHPPTLYLGYVGLSVAFSLAVGAMLTGSVGSALARAMRPWVLGSWIFLTAGILAGSYWAYYELGWGGYWFWDPVENASLMPWIAATALLHSVGVLAARNALKAWTMMLALIGFSMSMVGTFLVRSGILTSVHAFAVDPERGAFILFLLTFYIGAALLIFGWKIGHVRDSEPFEPVSREGALVANNLLLSVILALVFIGTLYPILAEAMGEQISVGPPYFNTVIGPLALILALLLFVGPKLRWRRGGPLFSPLGIAGLLLSAAMLVITFLLGWNLTILERLGLSIAPGLALASLAPLWGRNLLRTPAPITGMVVAHLGLAVLLAGMAAESGFTKERLVLARPGEQIEVGPWTMEFEGTRPVAGPNWTAVEAELRASRGSGPVLLKPQSRYFSSPPTQTSEAALATDWDGQLYAVIGQGSESEGWQLRLWWKPLVTLIWLGGFLVTLGGLIALIGRWWGEWRRRRRLAGSGYRERRAW